MAWLQEYGYVLSALTVTALVVAWRLRTQPRDQPLLRRLLLALLPDIARAPIASRPLSARSIWLVGLGFVIVTQANLLLTD